MCSGVQGCAGVCRDAWGVQGCGRDAFLAPASQRVSGRRGGRATAPTSGLTLTHQGWHHRLRQPPLLASPHRSPRATVGLTCRARAHLSLTWHDVLTPGARAATPCYAAHARADNVAWAWHMYEASAAHAPACPVQLEPARPAFNCGCSTTVRARHAVQLRRPHADLQRLSVFKIVSGKIPG